MVGAVRAALQLLCLGVNFRTAPVEVREVLAVSAADTGGFLARLAARPALMESLLLSTCNRTELYATGEDGEAMAADLATALLESRGFTLEQIQPHLYWFEGLDAVDHLFRVACGLDSMVLGETQILGQVRDAYLQAHEAGAVGKVLHQALGEALAVGKRAQTETGIGKSAVSVSYSAVELARRVYRSLAGLTAMIIGAGETAELTLRHLQASGVGQVLVANRTPQRAAALAALYGGKPIAMAEISAWLPRVDVVISSTGAAHRVLSRDTVAEAVRHRRGRPIFLFDIAVPRDIEPECARLEGVYLYDIDDLQSVVEANLQERAREAQKVERLVEEEVGRFRSWLRTQEVVPTIRLLREKVDGIRRQEVEKALARLPDLTPHQRAVVEAMSQAIINKVLNDPTQRLKGLAGAGEAGQYVDAVAELFDLPAPSESAAKN